MPNNDENIKTLNKVKELLIGHMLLVKSLVVQSACHIFSSTNEAEMDRDNDE